MAMRRVTSTAAKSAPAAARRGIAGVAPVLHFPAAAKESKQDQVAHNTAVAIEMMQAQLGEKPAPYTRKYTQTINEIQTEIEDVLASCGGGEGGELEDGKELTPMQVVERVLRHGLWQYLKNSGSADYNEMEKWLVYTAKDQQSFSAMKRDQENAGKYKEFKAGSDSPCLPAWDWAEEYAATSDRELVAEKRKRYDAIAVTSFEKDDAAITAVLQAYKTPAQEKALDTLVEQITMFKPFLAKQVIQQKLIERNAEGQLSFSRWVDWNPDARDMAELEHDVHPKFIIGEHFGQSISYAESYKRYADVRMRTKEEVLARMDNSQASDTSGGSADAGDAARAALIAEIVKLQTRGAKEEESTEEEGKEEDPEAKAAAVAAAQAKAKAEAEKFKVSDSAIQSKGLIGLTFLDAKPAAAEAAA